MRMLVENCIVSEEILFILAQVRVNSGILLQENRALGGQRKRNVNGMNGLDQTIAILLE